MAAVQTLIKFPVRKPVNNRRKLKTLEVEDSNEDKENSPSKKAQLDEAPSSPVKTPSQNKAAPNHLNDLKSNYRLTKQALHTSLPDSLVGRETELKFVLDYITSRTESLKSGSLYISGAPGTGKTAVLNKALENVSSSSLKIYINCMSHRNSQAIYSNICTSLSSSSSQNGRSKKTSEKSSSSFTATTTQSSKDAIKIIEKLIVISKLSIVLVLDEIDSLDSRNQEVLYTIFEWCSLKDSKLILIGIANSLDLTDRILPRLQINETCKPELLNFAPYTKDEIAQIILNRLSKINGDQVLDPPAVHFCARKVSSMFGDLRLALDVCRRAVEVVEMEDKKVAPLSSNAGCKKVTVPTILKVFNEVYSQKVVSVRRDGPLTIPLHQMLIMCTMLLMGKGGKGTKEVNLGKLHDNFTKICTKNGVGRVEQSDLVSLCLALEDQGLLNIKKNKEIRLYKMSLRINETELETVVQDKTLLASVMQGGI